MKKIYVFLFLGLFLPQINYAQTISNACSDAVAQQIIVGNITTSQNISDATTNDPNPSSCATNVSRDGWFWFDATSTASTIVFTNLSSYNAIIFGYSGSCGSLSQIGCANIWGNSGSESLVLTTVIGTRYRIRIARSNGTGGTMTGTVGVYNSAPDECASAITLIQTSANTPVPYSVGNATQSLAPLTCTGYLSATAYDVWFKFVASSTNPTIAVTGSAAFDAVIDFRSGACTGTSVSCTDLTANGGAESISTAGLTVGTTYYIRVYHWINSGTSFPATRNFSISVYGTCSAPAAYSVTGGGSACAGGSGVAVGLSNSAVGYNYQLKHNGTNTGSPITGTATAISFANQTTAGTYTVVATYTGGTCTTTMTGSAVVTAVSAPTAANAGADQNICGTSTTLAGNVPSVGTGTWSIISGTGGTIANASSATSTFSGTSGSTYTLRRTISNSPCTASTDDVVITFRQNPTASNAGPDQNICGTSTTLAGNTPTVGTGAWSIVSGTGGTITASSSATSAFSGTAGSTYTLRWTTSNSPCTASTNDVVISLNSIPSATGSVVSQAICSSSNGSVTVSVSGGRTPYSYSWSNGSTSQNISGLATGSYSVTVTDANGCSTSTSVSVSGSSPTITASASSTSASCNANNGSASVTASGGTQPYSYSWSNGSSTQSIADLAQGSYSVTVSDANGCSSSTSVSVSGNSATITATASSASASCSASNGSASVSATGGTEPYSYSWSNGSSSQSISNIAQGSYTVTLSDANGCSTSTTVTVSGNAVTITASSSSVNASCNAGNGSASVSASGGTDPYSYSWSNGSSAQSISDLAAGSYSVTITDANGCNTSTSVTITNSSSGVSATLSSTDERCNGVNGSVGLTVSGGSAPYNYSWSNGASSQNISGISAGNYSVTISDANGCSTSASATISNTSVSISTSISASPFVCSGSSNGSATLNATGGNSPYSYNWSNGVTTQIASDLSSGTYSVIVTDADGCTASASVTLASKSIPSQPGTITATGASTAVCPPVNGIVLQTDNDPNATSYSWSAPTTPGITFVTASTTNIQTINIGTSTGSTYVVRVTASNECGASPYKSILFRRSVGVPELFGAANVCVNSTQNYSCSNIGATTYRWTGTTGMLINGNAAPYVTADTFVTVTYTAAFNTGTLSVAGTIGCFTSTYRTLAVSKNLPALSAVSGNSSICPQTTEEYSIALVKGAVEYIWTLPANTTGSSTTNSIDLNIGNFTGTGNLCVKAVNACGLQSPPKCKTVATGMPPTPGGITGPTLSTCSQTVNYSVTNNVAYTYNWTVPSGASINGSANGNSINVTIPGNLVTGVVSVRAVNSCGTSGPRTLTVSGKPATPGVITKSISPVCANSQGVVFTSDVSALGSGCTYLWTYPSSATYVSGQGTPNLTLNWGSSAGVVSLRATNTCGFSLRTLVVTVGCARLTEDPQQNSNDNTTTETTAQEPEKENVFNLQAYPDADQNSVTFTFNASQAGSFSYGLYDNSNREVLNGTIDAHEGVNMQEMDMSSLPPNTVYRLKLDNGAKSTHINIKMK